MKKRKIAPVKKLTVMIIAAILLILPAQAVAEAKSPLSYERSAALMNLNNSTLKKLRQSENDALKQYKDNVESAKNIDINGFTTQINNKDVYISYNPDTRLMMRKKKELVPEQMKYQWESAEANRIITANSLQAGLRNIFFNVYSTQSDVQIKQKLLSLASAKNKQDQYRLETGIFNVLDLQEADYNLLKAQKDVEAANRKFDNAVRSFNQNVGLPSKTRFTKIIYEDVLAHTQLKPVDYYVNEALANRFDMESLRTQLALKEQEKMIIESGNAYKNSTTSQDEYERLLNDLEQLSLDLEGMKLSIINEIKDAYVDVLKTGKSVDSMNNTLKLQRSSYASTQTGYKEGTVSQNTLAQAEISLLQIENSYRASLYDYNTRILRFNNATGIGPGY